MGILSTEQTVRDVALQQTDGLFLAAPIMTAAGASQGRISVDQVDSLFLTITTISFLPVLAEDDTTEASWQVIELSEPLTVDLLALPSEEDSAVVIASGTLPEGEYERMRLPMRYPGESVLPTRMCFHSTSDIVVSLPCATSGTTLQRPVDANAFVALGRGSTLFLCAGCDKLEIIE